MLTLRTVLDGLRVFLTRERVKATVVSHSGHFVTVRLQDGTLTNRNQQTGVKLIKTERAIK